MMNTTAPAAGKGSPLDNALASFSKNYTAAPTATKATKAKADTNHTDATKRQAHVPSVAYRPAYAYLGEANPGIYGTPGPASSPVGSLRLAFPHGASLQSTDAKVVDATQAKADLNTNGRK
ncbi:hypothetical protein PLEOSDRAFT_158949 [Pleurotus ostreatus PC15]|uniref:Uncharacterized protein n=1 Tax=Pleurotus ostreatus (strain PC15) TaxID=1137138 RepID=A0A067NSR7_PLEO1|nr:hypothetical protein PLEOSDRAFT_158949 [Pleurotus ostreatus PC15]